MARESLLVIIEKYDGFINYIYPIVQNMDRKHGHAQTADSHNLKSKIRGMYEQRAA